MNVGEKFIIHTGMGRSTSWKNLGLSISEIETLNSIGYSGSNIYGTDATGFENFLNTLDPDVKYSVRKTKSDSGDCSETYEVIRTREVKIEKKGNIEIFEGFAEDIIGQLSAFKGEYVRVSIENIQQDFEAKKKKQLLKEREALLEKIKLIDTQL